jgi:hypothetical protein
MVATTLPGVGGPQLPSVGNCGSNHTSWRHPERSARRCLLDPRFLRVGRARSRRTCCSRQAAISHRGCPTISRSWRLWWQSISLAWVTHNCPPLAIVGAITLPGVILSGALADAFSTRAFCGSGERAVEGPAVRAKSKIVRWVLYQQCKAQLPSTTTPQSRLGTPKESPAIHRRESSQRETRVPRERHTVARASARARATRNCHVGDCAGNHTPWRHPERDRAKPSAPESKLRPFSRLRNPERA